MFAAWVEFENDVIDQDRLFKKFFADGRHFDGDALVQHMVRAALPCRFCRSTALIVRLDADLASLIPGGALQVH